MTFLSVKKNNIKHDIDKQIVAKQQVIKERKLSDYDIETQKKILDQMEKAENYAKNVFKGSLLGLK